jgi:transposase-like protein
MSQTPMTKRMMNGQQGVVRPEPEVSAKGQRRQFSKAYKLRMLAEVAQCSQPGEVGALLRREGLYGSHLSKWRQEQASGRLVTSGQRPAKATASGQQVAALERENAQLRSQLAQAELIIKVQKKLVQTFERSLTLSKDGQS